MGSRTEWSTRSVSLPASVALCPAERCQQLAVLVGLMADKAVFSPWERFLHRRWVPEWRTRTA